MSGVATSMSIQDRMTKTLEKIARANQRVNDALEVTDKLTTQSDMDGAFNRATASIQKAEAELQDFNNRQQQVEQGADKVKGAWGGIGGAIKAAMAAFSVKKITDGIKNALDLFNTQYTYEVQLAVVMKGAGLEEQAFDAVKQRAAELQRSTTFGDESLIAGAAELGTYIKDANAIQAMMGTLTDYAAGMGGVSADPAQMVEYATQLGKALDGTYDGLRKKGFELSDAQKQIIENGTDMEKVAVITDVINQSWEGLSESFANTPAGKIEQVKNNIGDMSEMVGGRLSPAILSLMEAVDRLISSDETNGFINGVIAGLEAVINGLTWVIDKINAVGQFVQANWSIIQPILIGIAAGVAAWAAVTAVLAVKQWLLNTALLSSPLTWIILAIVAVVAAIAYWVNSIGGLRVAWLTVVNSILTAWDWVKIGFMTGVYWVADLLDKMSLKFKTAGANIANAMGDMKADVLMMLQNMVNGAIDILNFFIDKLNKLPFVSIEAVEQVTFGTTAQLENEANKRQRNEDLAAYRESVESRIADRDQALKDMKNEAREATALREAEIAALKAERAENNASDDGNTRNAWEDAVGGAGTNIDEIGSVGEVGSIRDDVNIAEEDLKFMRDVAEMRYVQNFVTLTPTVAMDVQNVNQNADIDHILDEAARRLEEEFVASAEGVYA